MFFVSCSCPRSCPSLPVGMPDDTINIGCDSAYALAAAVIVLVNPGPPVATTTPGRPVTRKGLGGDGANAMCGRGFHHSRASIAMRGHVEAARTDNSS